MKQLYALNLVQKEGTNEIVTPILLLEPGVEKSVDEMVQHICIKLDDYGISTSKHKREAIQKFFLATCEISNMTRRRIYIDEQVRFTITPIYTITNTNEVKDVLSSFINEMNN